MITEPKLGVGLVGRDAGRILAARDDQVERLGLASGWESGSESTDDEGRSVAVSYTVCFSIAMSC